MLERGKIGDRQLMIIVTLYTIGDSILVLPTIVTAEAKQDAWIAGLIGVAVGPLLIVFLYDALRKCYPNLTLIEYSEKILGKWFGKMVSILFLIYFFITAATYLREIGDFVATEFMPRTPMVAVITLFMLVILMASRLGLETLARSAEIFFPIVLFLIIVLILFLFQSIQMDNLKPMLEGGMKPIIRGTIPFVVLPFMEPVAILMILPYVSKSEKIRKRLFQGTLAAGVVLIVMTLLMILVLGTDFTSRHLYPTFELAKSVDIEGILKVEALLAFLWLITIFIRLSLFFYVTSLGLAQTLGLKEYRHLLFPLAMIIIIFTMNMAKNIVEYNQMITDIWPYYAMTFGFFIPLFMLIVARLRMAIN